MIDLHCDTIYSLDLAGEGNSLISNSITISKDRLLKGNVEAQCFALYVHNKDLPHSPWTELNRLHDRFLLEIENAGILQMRKISEFDGTLKAVLTTEEGASIEGDISRLNTLKKWGVMIFGLIWNFENELAYPNSNDRDIMGRGLKEKGFEAVAECERLGIGIDVSHLSDGGFWDVVRKAKKPFFATHSNARAVTPVSRNLTDEMIRALSDKGGVMGLCLHPSFLGPVPEDMNNAVSHLEDMVLHTEHVYRVGGEDILSIGSDIDGIPGRLEYPYPDIFLMFFDELRKRGISSSVIDKMMGKNALRVFRELAV